MNKGIVKKYPHFISLIPKWRTNEKGETQIDYSLIIIAGIGIFVLILIIIVVVAKRNQN